MTIVQDPMSQLFYLFLMLDNVPDPRSLFVDLCMYVRYNVQFYV